MRPLVRYALAPAVAAALVVVFEVVRTLAAGDTHLGSAGQVLGFAAAVAGLLGFPLWVGGAVVVALVDAGRAGWAWGRGEAPAPSPARRAAWVVYGLLGLLALTLIVQAATVKFVGAFRKPVYQGLGAGLVAAGAVAGLAAVAGPVVGLLARGFGVLGRRLPARLDPTRWPGAALWGGGLLVAGAFGAPLLLDELHTVDLRAPRLALAWVLGLAALVALGAPRARGRGALIAAAALAATYIGGLGWSAGALGRSQSRLLALDRDTLLAGAVARRLRRLGDQDSDGVPGLFGGADCDDADPAVRPGVYDPPEDGVDQNCTGGDLVRAEDPLKPPARQPPDPGRPRHNVVLVTIDALRADVVAEHMPNLRRLAAEGIDFRNAYSHGAATYWSIPALLQSTVPSRLVMGRDQTPVGSELLLTEVLRDAGWHTGLYANVTIFFVRGLRQGVQVANYDTSHFTVHGKKPGSAHLTDGLLGHVRRWKAGKLRPARDRFFLWGHYYDPHDPYFEVPGHPARGDSDRARYEAIVRYVDAELGRLVDGLKAEGLWDSTILVVTADHGDEFLDHGHRFHGKTLYEEMTHVPLVMHVPGVPPRALDTPIGHMEVAPTLLDLLGLRVPPDFLGRSRAQEILTGRPAPVEPVYLEVLPDRNYASHQVGMRLGDLKLIHRIDEGYFELYDLAADPAERRNLFDVHPAAADLRRRLGLYLDHHLDYLGRGKTGARLPPGAPKAKPRVSRRGKKGRKASRR